MTDPIQQASLPEGAEQPSPLEARVDWQATFREFSKTHGDNPVVHGGRLLWQDGWSHSKSSYRGPQWPPPADLVELTRLQLSYWRGRKAVVAPQLKAMKDMLEGLKNLRRASSGPIMHRMKVRDEETGLLTTKAVAFSEEQFLPRLSWMEADEEACDRRITELADDLKSVEDRDQQLRQATADATERATMES